MRDNLYEELEHVFDKFPKYYMNILLGDFNAKEGRENIFKPTTGNKNLHVISNDNGVEVVNFGTSKNQSKVLSRVYGSVILDWMTEFIY
jgi:hypothetical protein